MATLPLFLVAAFTPLPAYRDEMMVPNRRSAISQIAAPPLARAGRAVALRIRGPEVLPAPGLRGRAPRVRLVHAARR